MTDGGQAACGRGAQPPSRPTTLERAPTAASVPQDHHRAATRNGQRCAGLRLHEGLRVGSAVFLLSLLLLRAP